MNIRIISFFLCLIWSTACAPNQEGGLYTQVDKQLFGIMQNLLNAYQRPFTTLDLSPRSGDVSFAIAQNYDAVCVMADTTPSLLGACKA